MTGLQTADELAQLRTRRDDPAFAAAWTSVHERAERAIRARLRPARQGAGWGHAYYCPAHVVVLEFDPDRPDRHRCPAGGEMLGGPSYDAGWRSILNSHLLDGLGACSLAWQATGEHRYRDHVADILLSYASLYPDLPPQGEHVGKGRVTGQSLEEAVWGIAVAHAYDRVRDALSAADRSRIETDLLGAVGAHVKGQLLHKIHNIECWHLASLASLGVLLDDEPLLTTALHGEHALPAQLAEGILEDGWWAEGSPSYHFYMLQSILCAAVALRHRDPAFLDSPRLLSTFTAPLTMLRSDLSLPALNDGWVRIALPLGIAGYSGLYEQAYGLWHDESHAAFLRRLYGRGAVREAETALTMGPDLGHVGAGAADGAVDRLPAPRRVHPSSGYAILADDDGDDGDTGPGADGSGGRDRFLLLKYGPHGGGHGHPDKLALDLHAFGVRLAPDAGSPAYNSPLQGPWFRQTLSHNTVLLGEQSQPEAEGRLLGYVGPHDVGVGLADALVEWSADGDGRHGRQGSWLREPRRVRVAAYAGASARRCVLWKPAPQGYFVDLVLVVTADEVPVDLAWHHRGRQVEPEPARLGDVDLQPEPTSAYAYLEDVRMLGEVSTVGAEGSTWYASWEVDGAGTRMWGIDPPTCQTLVAQVPSNPPVERQAMLLRRSRGPHTCYASVIEAVACPLDGDVGAVRAVRWSANDLADGGGLSFEVEHAAGTDRWAVMAPAGVRSTVEVVRSGNIATYRCDLADVDAVDARA